MYLCKLLLLLSLTGFGVYAQTINIRGKITDVTGKPLSNAIVVLTGQKCSDTTGVDGTYSLTKNSVTVLTTMISSSDKLSMNNGVLEFNLKNQTAVTFEIFDINGNLLTKESYDNVSAGAYRMNLAENSRATNLHVVHVSIGQKVMTFHYLPLCKWKYAVNTSEQRIANIGSGFAKIAAVLDTIKVTAEGYIAKTVKITSYDTTIDISLNEGTETVCEGCGKTNHPVSGKATIDVDGTKREYMLKLPDNYEPGKQHKLIFCPHWLGGTIDDIVNGKQCNGPYYGLEKLSNGTAIFVAPQGLKDGSNTGFSNTNGRDIEFFKAMIKYFNSTLCIDQKRIFSTGFSFGGMMSYAIGCSMSDVFRAIAPMSGAFYSGCDSSSQGSIAVWMAHGKSDNVVPLKNGQTALNYFLARNGCNNETTPVEPSPCVQYGGCKEGYPVIYCPFDGGHGPQSFAPAATWKFFSQF